jgi:hypothetical protein
VPFNGNLYQSCTRFKSYVLCNEQRIESNELTQQTNKQANSSRAGREHHHHALHQGSTVLLDESASVGQIRLPTEFRLRIPSSATVVLKGRAVSARSAVIIRLSPSGKYFFMGFIAVKK